MGLFQKPARTAEEVERGRPLGLPPEQVAELGEEAWDARAFRGDAVPQLTVRAVLMGSVIGFGLSFGSVYLGLKSGWGIPVSITACIVSFTVWTALLKAKVARTPMSILENNCMQSAATAAGSTTSGMATTAAPALLLATVTAEHPGGRHLPWPVLAAWIAFTGLLGAVMAIPMKRNMINHDRLPFPSAMAAAVTLQALYNQGAEALRKGRALLYAALAASLTPLLMDLELRHGEALLPSTSRSLDWLPARGIDAKTGARFHPSDWTIVLDHKLMLVAGGMIVGLRTCLSMAVGGLILAYVVGPAALSAGAVSTPSQAWLEIGIWVGAPMLVTSGLLSAAGAWRSLLRGLRGLAGGGPQRKAEVPIWTFIVGVLVAGTGVIVLGQAYFEIPWLLGALGVALTFVLSLAACRATGETDMLPLGPMAAMTQLAYGALLPFRVVANVMSASLVNNAAWSSADMLTDLKSGHLLGASPRRQFLAQVLGILPGTAAAVLAFRLLVPDARVLTGDGVTAAVFPAPSAQMWLAMARILTHGLGSTHPFARRAIVIGALVGVAMTLLERLPARRRRFLPSAMGLGLGMVMPFQYVLSLVLGAVIAAVWTRHRPEQADRYLYPVASGAIAGESMMGVVAALINNFFLGGH